MEIEYKYPVDDVTDVRKRVLKAGFTCMRRSSQRDTYFIVNQKNAEGEPVYLRVREDCEGHSHSIDYHRVRSDAATHETEVHVADAKRAVEILSVLHPVICVVSKVRETFRRENITVVLDAVENLGTFVEIETENDVDDDREIVRVAIELGLDLQTRVKKQGYPDLLAARARDKQHSNNL